MDSKETKNINFIFIILAIISAGLLFAIGSSSTYIINDNLNVSQTNDYYVQVARGEVPNTQVIHKFGASTIGTTMQPITESGIYRTPTSPVQLAVYSTSALDTYGGLGANTIVVEGLNGSWERVLFEVNMNGTNNAVFPINLTRLYGWYVNSSGTYANATIGSHYGELRIRQVNDSLLWSSIDINPIAEGQSTIGVYSCAKGYEAYIISKSVFVDSVKPVDIYLFKREYINQTTAPYSPMRLLEEEYGVSGAFEVNLKSPIGTIKCPADFGLMGLVDTGSGRISVEFGILLIKTE